MSNLPLVSVMCPVYNAEAYLELAMRSVLDQDYPNLQLVISDDCSADASRQVATEVAAQYPHRSIVLNFNEKNLGITANCNHALSLCTGEFVCLFAGDDLMYPDKIRRQVESFAADPGKSLCFHGVDVINDVGEVTAVWQDTRQRYNDVSDIIRHAGIPYASAMMVRSSAIPAWRYDSRVPSASDWLFLIEVAARGGLVPLDGVFGAYRRHGQGASRRTFDLMSETMLTLDIVRERYAELNLEPACRAGRRRYLLGEVARLILAGDHSRLALLRKQYAGGDPIIALSSFLGEMSAKLGIQKSPLFLRAYSLVARKAKS
jgi:glycosyltransferase involved in cell wall biosynthesis